MMGQKMSLLKFDYSTEIGTRVYESTLFGEPFESE